MIQLFIVLSLFLSCIYTRLSQLVDPGWAVVADAGPAASLGPGRGRRGWRAWLTVGGTVRWSQVADIQVYKIVNYDQQLFLHTKSIAMN